MANSSRVKKNNPIVKIKETKKKKNDASAEQLAIIQRQTRATDLRVQGLSYRQIANVMRTLGYAQKTYSEGLAFKDVHDAMNRILAEQREVVEHNIYQDLRRLDSIFARVWPLALPQSDEEDVEPPPPNPIYISASLAVMEKRAVLLNYKSVLEKKEDDPNVTFTVEWSKLTTDEILEIRQRISDGEKPLDVLATIESRKALAREMADRADAEAKKQSSSDG